MLVVSLASLARIPWKTVELSYSVLSFCTMMVCASLISNHITDRKDFRAAWVVLSVSITAILLDTYSNAAQGGLHYIFFPVIHSGSLIVALVSLLLLLQFARAPSRRDALALFIVAALGVASDRIFVGVFVLPAIPALFALAISIGKPGPLITLSRAVLCSGLILVATIAGIGIDRLLFSRWLTRDPDIAIDIAAQIAKLPIILHDKLVLIEVVATILIVVLPWFSLRTRPVARYVWLAAAGSSVGSLVLLPLLYVDASATRYAQPIWWWAVILLSSAAVRVAPRWAPLTLAAVAAGGLGIASQTGAGFFRPDSVVRWRHPVEQCLSDLRQSGTVHAGIAGYWLAKPIEVSSDWTLQVLQVSSTGRMFNWQNNIFYNTHSRADASQKPVLDFIVMQTLDRSAILGRFGTPARIISCAGTEIWTYGEAQTLNSRIIGIDSLRSDGLVDTAVRFRPGELLTLEGPLPEDGTAPDVQTQQPSIATFGPYIEVRPGRWRITLSYKLTGKEPSGAMWDVLEHPGGAQLAAGPLEYDRPTKTIVVTVAKGRSLIEFRTLTTSGQRLTIQGLMVCPADMPEGDCR